METRGRGVPLRKKKRSQIKGQLWSTFTPLWSGAQRKDVQMQTQVEGSEGGMTNGAFSQNAPYTRCLSEVARGTVVQIVPHLFGRKIFQE